VFDDGFAITTFAIGSNLYPLIERIERPIFMFEPFGCFSASMKSKLQFNRP